jgi:hypothetical protein
LARVLIRLLLPKTTNFAKITLEQLEQIEGLVDNRPSGVLGERVGLLLESGSEAFQRKSGDALLDLIHREVITILFSHNLNAIQEIWHGAI